MLDQTANIWCKHCLYGDSIIRMREARILESSYITDTEDIHDTHYHEIEEEEDVSFTFQCENCGIYSENIEEIATSNVNEALRLYGEKHKSQVIDYEEEEE